MTAPFMDARLATARKMLEFAKQKGLSNIQECMEISVENLERELLPRDDRLRRRNRKKARNDHDETVHGGRPVEVLAGPSNRSNESSEQFDQDHHHPSTAEPSGESVSQNKIDRQPRRRKASQHPTKNSKQRGKERVRTKTPDVAENESKPPGSPNFSLRKSLVGYIRDMVEYQLELEVERRVKQRMDAMSQPRGSRSLSTDHREQSAVEPSADLSIPASSTMQPDPGDILQMPATFEQEDFSDNPHTENAEIEVHHGTLHRAFEGHLAPNEDGEPMSRPDSVTSGSSVGSTQARIGQKSDGTRAPIRAKVRYRVNTDDAAARWLDPTE